MKMELRWGMLAFCGLASLRSANGQQQHQQKDIDPIKNMCERWYHQSTVKNNVLYIDGGVETFVHSNFYGNATGKIVEGYNPNLITVDMSSSWDWKVNISQALLNKTANPNTGTLPPQVSNGALYHGPSDDSKIYLFGGTTSFINMSSPTYQPPSVVQYSLWSFDTESKVWGQSDVTSGSPHRPNRGAWTDAPDHGLAFYMNGRIDNGSSQDTAFLNTSTQTLSGMIVIDTKTSTVRNVSTATISNGTDDALISASMQYFPGIGAKGVLAVIGGAMQSATNLTGSNNGSEMAPMDRIPIFDISSLDTSTDGKWYLQPATGDIPPQRVEHCVVGASAADNSSHNIYVYGGRNNTALLDDIYVLSIPQFHWTRIYEGQSPRYGMTCHTVGQGARQMLTVGGQLYEYDKPNASCDWEFKGVAIYDLSTLTWGSVYNAEAAPYQVPSPVITAIGGTANGSATMTRPANDFADPALSALFYPPPASSPSGLSGGAIAGIVIGCIAAVALLGFALWWFFGRRRHHDNDHPDAAEMSNERPPAELFDKESGVGATTTSGSPGSRADSRRALTDSLSEKKRAGELDGGGNGNARFVAELEDQREPGEMDVPEIAAAEVGPEMAAVEIGPGKD